MAAPNTIEAPPSTLAAFIRLCRTHGNAVVTREDSLESGNCTGHTDRFIDKYLEGRTEVPLKDLIPFIHSGHVYWGQVMFTIETALIRLGVLQDRETTGGILEPSRQRNVDLH